MTEKTSPPDEIAALGKIVRVLETLDEQARSRAVTYLYDRYSTVPAADD
jgi:hypothetical protein